MFFYLQRRDETVVIWGQVTVLLFHLHLLSVQLHAETIQNMRGTCENECLIQSSNNLNAVELSSDRHLVSLKTKTSDINQSVPSVMSCNIFSMFSVCAGFLFLWVLSIVSISPYLSLHATPLIVCTCVSLSPLLSCIQTPVFVLVNTCLFCPSVSVQALFPCLI